VHILEPMTVATDYALGVLGLVLGNRLWKSSGPEGLSGRLWAGMLLAMAVAAFAGGTSHGFADRLGVTGNWALWRLTVWSIGIASLCIVAATARFAFSTIVGRWVTALFAVQFAIYAVWMVWHDDFGYVILEYVSAMVLVAAVSLWRWFGHGWSGGPWVVGGILVSFLAAGVQMSGFALHEHFNHNDLYHVIQMAGFILLYRGGGMLGDRPGG